MKTPLLCRLSLALYLPLIALPTLVHADASAAAALPLKDVVLFSSGVGYFGRQGRIEGAAQVDLPFRATQISDILKSLVLTDPNNGIGPVTYALTDYVAARPVAPLRVPVAATIGEVLKGFQGAQVRLVKPSGAVEGRILSVATRQVKMGTEWTNVEVLTLLGADGMVTTQLDDVISFKLADPALDAALRDSLARQGAAFTAKVDDGVRLVSLHFTGKKARTVAAGYLEETPAWKTSYRLVVDGSGKANLQGWAIVENTTDADWDGVHLDLVSGQPVSFIQDLYAPVYVTRPVVPTSVIGSARPQTYGESYDIRDTKLAAIDSRITEMESKIPPPPKMTVTMGINGGGLSNSIENRVGGRNFAQGLLYDRQISTPNSQASGSKRGELFAYDLETPVTLPAGKAAMVPIVGGPVEGKPVTIAISSDAIGELTPANGFRLKNTTGAHLQGGPITVYAGGIYAGDALVTDLAPDETRLVSYAADLDTAVRLDAVQQSNEITKLSALAGMLSVTTRYGRTRTFLIKNKSAVAKSVLLQVPLPGDWKLANPAQLLEKSPEGNRFEVQVPAGQTVTYSIEDGQTQTQTQPVFGLTADWIVRYSAERSISPELKARLLELQTRRDAIAAVNTQRENQEKQLAAIETDQARIRQNMHELNNGSVLYKSYEAKLGAQEPQVEALHAAIDRLRDQAAQLTKDLAAYAAALSAQ